MTTATELLRDLLKGANIDHQFDEKENKVSFKIDDTCKVEVHKHMYVNGYGIGTRCDIGKNKMVDSSASFIDRLMVIKDKDYFYLYGISNDSALNAGKIETKIPIKTEPKDTGKFYIKCDKEFGYDCKIEKSNL